MRTAWISISLMMVFHEALALNIHCPDKIHTKQFLEKKMRGWDGFVDDLNLVHRFYRVTFYAGHPREHASLAPDHEDSQSNKTSWNFTQGEIWLACGYSNTDIQLIQAIPASIKKCTVSYGPNFSRAMAIQCN